MIIFGLLFIGILTFFIIKDMKITEKKQNKPLYYPKEIVYHSLSNSIFKIVKQATQEELKENYPSFSHRPYSAYWVSIIKLGSYNEDITLIPIAESSLVKI